MKMLLRLTPLLVLLALTQCAPPPVPEVLPKLAEKPEFQKTAWRCLPGWDQETFEGIGPALTASCKAGGPARRLKAPQHDAHLGTQDQWRQICTQYAAVDPKDPKALKTFFETHFTPLKVTSSGGGEGLFTGYYEPELRGSLTKTGPHTYPLYKRPKDLLVVEDLGIFHPDFKGRRLTGKVKGHTLVPYDNRRAIDAKKPAPSEVLAWVDSPVDAFFLHIQGSGRVRLPSGELLHVGYDAQNGHSYVAIGKVLKEWGELSPPNISMQSIRKWIADHPERAQELMHQNPSYVFFKKTKAATGALGTKLTAGRSLAVDTAHYPLGLPVWIDVAHPTDDGLRLQNLMIAEDTGGAIKGVVRGDFFWGAGENAATRAGLMKSPGSLYVLVPQSMA